MKKITLTLAIAIAASPLFAQDKAIKEIEKNYLLGKIEAAKELTDKLVADPANANKADAWLWKSTLDAVAFSDEALKAKCADCLNSSYNAFLKYESLEPTLGMAAEPTFSWKPLGVLYDAFYAKGVTAYQAKDYATAFDNFDKSAHFSKIIMKKDIRKNGGSLDTLPILMSAYAAHNAQKTKEALAYYSMAADKKFGGENDKDIYKYLLFNYGEMKDKDKFDKYLAIAMAKYPNDNFEDYKIDFIGKSTTLDEKIALYDAEDSKGTMSAGSYMNFGDWFSNFKKEDKEMLEKNTEKKLMLHDKAKDAFKKAYQKNNDVLAAFNVGVLNFNDFNDLDDSYRANVKAMQDINANKTAEKDPKKKAAADAKVKTQLDPLKKANAEIEAKMVAYADNSIEWLEKATGLLKDKADKSKLEKQSYKNALRFLGILFEYKREKVKGKDPKAYDSFDAKSKQYYEMYDKQ